MDTSFENSHFQIVPNEILVHILSYVDTGDLLHFCQLYKCEWFFRNRGVVKTINLYKRYEIQNLRYISKMFQLEFVTTLNINGLYWVSATDLRKFVSKMTNLECLYALKTNLELSNEDIDTYNKTKMEKLAVTIRTIRESAVDESKMNTLHTLCLDVVATVKPDTYAARYIRNLWRKNLTNITSLWLEVEECCQQYLFLTLNLEISNKIVCQVSANTPATTNSYCLGFKRYHNERRLHQPYVACFDKTMLNGNLAATEKVIYENASAPWQTLYHLHCSKPYGPEDAKHIFMNHAGLDEIDFQELNFTHTVCNTRCIEASREILKQANVKKLKKLAVMMCLFQLPDTNVPPVQEETISFKRKRVGVNNLSENEHLKKIIFNLPNVEHLEVYFCKWSSMPVVPAISAYRLIANFAQLKHLTLEIPIAIDGSFLAAVTDKCKLLESLKIKAVDPNQMLDFYVHQALPAANSLKDFRYENRYIHMDTLLESLCEIKTNKLERIMLVCKQIDKFSSGPLKHLLTHNFQLIFLYFVIEEGTQKFMKIVQRTLNEYKKRHPANCYLIKKTNVFTQRGFPIPDVHFNEIVRPESTVATLNAYEQFSSF